MMEFFKTIMGNRFFEGHVPQLVKNLGDIAAELKRANDLKEREVVHRENFYAFMNPKLGRPFGSNPDTPQVKRPEPPKAPPRPPAGPPHRDVTGRNK